MAKNTALAAFKSGLKAKRAGRGRRKKFTIPLAVVGGFVPLTISTVNAFQEGGATAAGVNISKKITGYDPVAGTFSLSNMKCGTGAIVGGFLVHWLVGSKLGINRMLGRTGVPFIRI